MKIKELKPHLSYAVLLSFFEISESGFYHWLNRRKKHCVSKSTQLKDQIKFLFEYSKKTYGSPRIYKGLQDLNFSISENTVAKYMREMGLDARLEKKYRRTNTTDSSHQDAISNRLFKTEDGVPTRCGEVLAGDITYLRLSTEEMVYLAVVMDICNREVVGWSMSDNLEKSLVLKALQLAMRVVEPCTKIIFHSDRGSQYASEAYRNLLKRHNIIPSMSRRGNCYDNAYVESFFSTLKKEWLYRHRIGTKEEMRALVFEYIEVWYNRKRKHSSLGFLSPVEYKQQSRNFP